MAGQPLAGGWPEGSVYQARMRRPSKLDMMTRQIVRVLMPPSITNGSLDSTGSTLASMSTLASATCVWAQNFRISSPVAIPYLLSPARRGTQVESENSRSLGSETRRANQTQALSVPETGLSFRGDIGYK